MTVDWSLDFTSWPWHKRCEQLWRVDWSLDFTSWPWHKRCEQLWRVDWSLDFTSWPWHKRCEQLWQWTGYWTSHHDRDINVVNSSDSGLVTGLHIMTVTQTLWTVLTVDWSLDFTQWPWHKRPTPPECWAGHKVELVSLCFKQCAGKRFKHERANEWFHVLQAIFWKTF